MLPGDFHIGNDLTYTTSYVFRGVKESGNSFQPTVEASAGDFYVGLWANLPTRGGSKINYYGGVTALIPEVDFAILDAGLTVYHYPRSGEDRSHEFYFGGMFPSVGRPELSGTLYYFYDVDIRSHLVEAALTYTWSLEGWGLPAAVEFTGTGGVEGGSGTHRENYHYYGGSVKLPFHLSGFTTLTPGVHYATAEKFTFGPGERGKNFFWSISVSSAF